jgi:hypothetical protein
MEAVYCILGYYGQSTAFGKPGSRQPAIGVTLRGSCALLFGLVALGHGGSVQGLLWQADLQVRAVTVSDDGGRLTVKFTVLSEFGEARAARVEVLLPVGVGIVEMGAGCHPGPSAPGISVLRATVVCALGNLPARAQRNLYVITTRPPEGVRGGFGVIVLSDTPDPKPGNNFAERGVP